MLASTKAAEAAQGKKNDDSSSSKAEAEGDSLELAAAKSGSWRRILLLVFAITLHNIPEGLAVGVSRRRCCRCCCCSAVQLAVFMTACGLLGLAWQVAFGGLGTDTCKKLDTCSFEDAFNLALGIGIQNFPEGLAVSMPLRRSGEQLWKRQPHSQRHSGPIDDQTS